MRRSSTDASVTSRPTRRLSSGWSPISLGVPQRSPETPEERLAHIEERIVALHEAEKAFARTQAELAARSADLATREAALAENARLGVVDAGPVIPSRAEMAELDERLRRLERETRDATKESGFGDSLRALENRGLRGGSGA